MTHTGRARQRKIYCVSALGLKATDISHSVNALKRRNPDALAYIREYDPATRQPGKRVKP